jgi:TRAP-type C4-dicarboxylate transport system substrate-binding protein
MVYKPMLDEIEQKSSGKIKFTIYASGSLVNNSDQYDAIRGAVVDLGVNYFTYIASRFPLYEAFTFPAVYNMTNAAEDLIQALGNRIIYAAPSETKVLSFFQQQPYYLYTTSKQDQ